jgi:hypothetical protein
VSPGSARHWYDFLLPIAQQGGPVLTLALTMVLIVSSWYGLGILRDCVAHNRQLNEKILAQQANFYTELRLLLARCDHAP